MKVIGIDGGATKVSGGVVKKINNNTYELIDPTGRPGSRRARIGFIHPRSLGGALLHLVEREELAGND